MASSTYPPPPLYYRLFSPDAKDPPPAPPPPISGEYVLFGATYSTDDKLPSLEEQGVRQLYPKTNDVDTRQEIRSLSRELSLLILELVDTLVERPSQFARRVEDIGLTFKNLHHLLNSLRPLQARATVRHMLETQIEMRKQALADIRERRAEARELLSVACQDLRDGADEMSAAGTPLAEADTLFVERLQRRAEQITAVDLKSGPVLPGGG